MGDNLDKRQTTESIPEELLEAEKRADKIMENIQAGKDIGDGFQDENTTGEDDALRSPDQTGEDGLKTPKQPEAPIDITPDDDKKKDYKHQYEVLQGKYNTEIRQLREQLTLAYNSGEELRATVAELKQQIASLQAGGEEGLKKPTSSGPDMESLTELDPEDFDHLGQEAQDLVVMVNRLTKQLAALTAGQSSQDITKEFNDLKETVNVSRKETFDDRITFFSPNWKILNKDPNFIAYAKSNAIAEKGITIIQDLNDAYRGGDAARVAQIFNDYEALLPKKANPNPKVTKQDLRARAMPDVAPDAQTGKDTGKEDLITKEEVQAAADLFRLEGTAEAEKNYELLVDKYMKQQTKGQAATAGR